MILVKQRKDLLDDNLEIPVKLFDGKGIQYRRIDQWVYGSQPDELDNSEFNLCLYRTDNDGSYILIGVAIAIDFDFGRDIEL